MTITRRALPRRTFLRGAGATVALPLLDAMVPSLTALARTPAAPVRRLGFVYAPMGAVRASWTPPGDGGALAALSPTLGPLAPVRERVTVIDGLRLESAAPGTHATAVASFLTAARARWTEGTDCRLGTSVDQIAASHIGRATPLPSVELSLDVRDTGELCDHGYAGLYQQSLSWSSPTTPLAAEAHPRVVFERLFGAPGRPPRRDGSLLDTVRDDVGRLHRAVGPADRVTVGAYLDSVRDVERRIQRAELEARDTPTDVDRPVGAPRAYADHARLMFDLQVLALRGDLSRVFTLQLAREASRRTYPEIGVRDPHHAISHHGADPARLAMLARINRYHVSLFAAFLEQLASVHEGDGTLLDHVVYLYGSGMGDPDAHDHVDLPIVVAGGGGGRVRGGRHITHAAPTPLANLHLTLLDAVGVARVSFADSTGTIDQLRGRGALG